MNLQHLTPKISVLPIELRPMIKVVLAILVPVVMAGLLEPPISMWFELGVLTAAFAWTLWSEEAG